MTYLKRDVITDLCGMEAQREEAAKETLDPDQLRGLSLRWLKEAIECYETKYFQHAQRCTLLAADLQAKALELENRDVLKGVGR